MLNIYGGGANRTELGVGRPDQVIFVGPDTPPIRPDVLPIRLNTPPIRPDTLLIGPNTPPIEPNTL